MENGNLFIVGRKKDVIIRFGFNVYPSEVEGVFNMHPEIARSAVIGPTSDETGEQQIVAFIQPRPGSTVTSKELDRYGAQHLAFYKQPTRIYLVSDLPQTPAGKIAKGQLAERLGNEINPANNVC
jgi:acyl-CoA synthetase (AMP-forming)/AMP-acid ligase II